MKLVMKNITDYFTSPNKAVKSPEVVNIVESPKDQNVSPTKSALKSPKDIENQVENKKKLRKKKKRRKPTDPEVKNVAELFSNNLSLISPNTSGTNNKTTPSSTNKEQKGGSKTPINPTMEPKESATEDATNEPETIIIDTSTKNNQSSSQVNAFQFLMNSRNHIIGQNSDGKEAKDQNDSLCDEDKQKLLARKNLFKNWADQKGAGKRKREEEEVERCIDIKMKKRVKRIKNMIEGVKKKEARSKIKKKVQKLSSSDESENIIDLVSSNIETTRSPLIGVIEVDENAQDISISSKSLIRKQKELNDDSFEDEDTPKQRSSKEIIKIKMFTPTNTSRKKLVSEAKKEAKLNDSLDDFCSPVKKTAKKGMAKVSKGAKKDLDVDESSKDSDIIVISSSPRIDEEKCLKKKNKEKKVPLNDTDSPGRSLRKRTVKNYYTEGVELPLNIINKDNSVEEIELFSDSDNRGIAPEKPGKIAVKLAPLFKKRIPKPKVDPEVIEARRQFLISGVPDSLKKTIRKQQSYEDKEYDVFPIISHIQQKCNSKMWNLPVAALTYKEPICPDIELKKCKNLITKTLPYEINITTNVENIKNIKGILQQIKTENPDYPVFKVFRHIYEKSGKTFLNDTVNKKKKSPRKPSKKRKSKSLDEASNNIKDHEMWTEKYKPRNSEEILGNHHGVTELKKWLEIWMNYRQEINARKKQGLNSESEFESTDGDSRDSMMRLPGNTMVLYGPTGSGKSSAVYAIANELGFNVLELNASTKRTGKKLLNDLQEATQSHQVKKNGPFPNLSVDKPKHSKNMCILFMEDIDLIFDQDEGFLSSLNQLILTSKRPIILTTTDNTPVHVQKFISQYECINFMHLSMHCLGIWLQLVCLVEGILADKNDLGNLLEYNRGDIRKTILQVQFWSLTGGQLEKNKVLPLKTEERVQNTIKAQDVELGFDLKPEPGDGQEFVHKHCLGSFEIFRDNTEYCIPKNMDLGLLWWNLPNILNVPSCPRRLINEDNKLVNSNSQEIDINKLNSISNLYDSFSLCDSLYYNNCNNSNEPVVKNWSAQVLESLELGERQEDGKIFLVDLVKDLTHNVMNGCIENYNEISGTRCSLNMALPDVKERKWRASQHMCEDFLKSPIPLSNILERKSVALDYLSTLRHIARSEEQRATANTKRGNRFRHYLKDFVQFNKNHCNFACNILRID